MAALKAAGMRAELEPRNEKINYKVREHSLAKVPYLLVVGRREAEEAHRGGAPPGLERAADAGAGRGHRHAEGRSGPAGPAVRPAPGGGLRPPAAE